MNEILKLDGYTECMSETDDDYVFCWHFTVTNCSQNAVEGVDISFDVQSFQSDELFVEGPGYFGSIDVVWSVDADNVVGGSGPGSYQGEGVFFSSFSLGASSTGSFTLCAFLAKTDFPHIYLTVISPSPLFVSGIAFPSSFFVQPASSCSELYNNDAFLVLHAEITTPQTTLNGDLLVYDSVTMTTPNIFDYDSAGLFTCVVPGYYQVYFTGNVNNASAAGFGNTISIQIDGSGAFALSPGPVTTADTVAGTRLNQVSAVYRFYVGSTFSIVRGGAIVSINYVHSALYVQRIRF